MLPPFRWREVSLSSHNSEDKGIGMSQEFEWIPTIRKDASPLLFSNRHLIQVDVMLQSRIFDWLQCVLLKTIHHLRTLLVSYINHLIHNEII